MNALFSKFEEIRYLIYIRLSPKMWIFLGIILCILCAVSILILQKYDYLVIQMATGGVVFFLSWVISQAIVASRDERELTKRRNSRPLYPKRAFTINEARIANDLVPLVDKLPLKDSRLLLVGYDGEYILKEDKKLWENSLLKWLKKGLTVEYILVKPDPPREVIEAFRRIKEKKEGGELKVFVLKSDKGEKWKTYHPTLFWSGDKKLKAMWIEGDHPIGSRSAYDVTYVPPDAMDEEQKGKFQKHEKDIESLQEDCVMRVD